MPSITDATHDHDSADCFLDQSISGLSKLKMTSAI